VTGTDDISQAFTSI